MFIELTESRNQTKELINIKSIEHIKGIEKGSLVVFETNGKEYEESYDQVKALIKNEKEQI